MDEGELLRRIDRHLERGNELFDRNEAAFDRNTEAFERVTSKLDDDRTFMRELVLRMERSGREQARQMQRHTDAVVAEQRAQRGALLAILDRLGTGPDAPAQPDM